MNIPTPQIQQKIVSAQQSFAKQTSYVDKFFSWCIKNRNQIIFTFKIYYYALVTFSFVGGYSAYLLTDNFLFYYNLAIWSGKIGLSFYILTVIPGIARRFGIKHKLISLLMIFRRYNGIAMFLGILTHYIILRGAQTLRNGLPENLPPTFEILGLTALILTSVLFLTSNDFAVTHLRKWWNKIHQLTYVIIWLIAFHILLQRVSTWSILISATVFLQVASYVYSRFIKTKTPPTVK